MSFYQSKSLYDGVVAEFVVMDLLQHNNMVLEKGMGITECVQLTNAPSYPQSSKHHDLDLKILDCNTWDVTDVKTIEVKYAWNEKYPTFFAEIIQSNSGWYAEYLVYPPDYMFYVNGATKTLFCYDGKIFTDKVKSEYNNRRKNSFGSAEGVLFGVKSKEYGYLYQYPVHQNYYNVLKHKEDKIKHRLNASKGVYVNGSKTCQGLPNLA